ncbi:MAG TPA: hypothetical protein VHO67_17900 [Polyangia bacterium]|nr:hypothetical protein [Polyangia bacterium]
MKNGPVVSPAEPNESTGAVSLGLGWVASLQPRERGVVFRLSNPQQYAVDVEIVLTADGPVVRAAAAALEITSASEIVARCDRFTVDAQQSFSVRAAEIDQEARGAVRTTGAEVAVTARSGDVAIRANDDVSVNGEQVLLNCDRDQPVPSWVLPPPPPATTLPARLQDGDVDLLRQLDDGGREAGTKKD